MRLLVVTLSMSWVILTLVQCGKASNEVTYGGPVRPLEVPAATPIPGQVPPFKLSFDCGKIPRPGCVPKSFSVTATGQFTEAGAPAAGTLAPDELETLSQGFTTFLTTYRTSSSDCIPPNRVERLNNISFTMTSSLGDILIFNQNNYGTVCFLGDRQAAYDLEVLVYTTMNSYP